MLKEFRNNFIYTLWKSYYDESPEMQNIANALKEIGLHSYTLDHLAIIDLPGPHTGIPHLKDIFSILGYEEQGKDYLAGKQNDFLWMAEKNSKTFPAKNVLPQVVIADFRLDEMPTEIQNIILHYSRKAKPSPLNERAFMTQLHSSAKLNTYSQRLDCQQGASKRVEGVYTKYMTDDERACNAAENSSAKLNTYSQRLDCQQGASERVEGVYTKYMTDDERACNAAENSSAKSILLNYFSGRDWPLPTVNEYYTVREFNELLAWVLVFGRRPNHFTLAIHLLDYFPTLNDFHDFIEQKAHIKLNNIGGKIKGGENAGIAQSSTVDRAQTIKLADGNIQIPTRFIEFVWRYPKKSTEQKPFYWEDYFNGFLPQHADKVIESLYDS